MKRPKTVCQSCAAPLLIDYDHGSESDGSPSELYCRRCYRLGSFTEPKMTAEQMHEIVRVRMVELRFPRFLAKLSANGIYDLQRWTIPETVPITAAVASAKK
ncbi:MAG TPA: zinc ribbon domain-containing protein [bacterium]|nr:zinc ribbon domain-containing protein [bacterium]